MAQYNSRSPAEEASETFTQYSMGRCVMDGFNYQTLYAEKMGLKYLTHHIRSIWEYNSHLIFYGLMRR